MTLSLTTVTLNSPDPGALARFYSRLLDWPVSRDDGDWVVLRNPAGGIGLACQLEADYARPTWPATPGAPQMQLHLEIRADDLDAGVARALECGATLAEHQPQDDVRVCLDPDGHPFCVWIET